MIEALDVAIKLGFPILLGISGWAFTTLRDHDQRIRTLEATSQTKEDAAQVRAETFEVLSEIKVTLARIEERLNTKATRAMKRDEA